MKSILAAKDGTDPLPEFPNDIVRNEVHHLGPDFDRFLDAQAHSGKRDDVFEAQIRDILIRHKLPDA